MKAARCSFASDCSSISLLPRTPQRRTVADLFASRIAEGLDGAGGGGGDGMFHLHRFEDQQRRAFFHLLAGLGEQGDDLARHRRGQAAAVSATGFDQMQRVVAQE